MSAFSNIFSGVGFAKRLPDIGIGALACFLIISAFTCGEGKDTIYLTNPVDSSLQASIDSLKSIPKDTVTITALKTRYKEIHSTDTVSLIQKVVLCDSLIALYESKLEKKDTVNILLIRLYEKRISGLIEQRDSLLSQLNKPKISDVLKKIFEYDLSASIGTGLGMSLIRADASVRFRNYELGIEPSLSYVNKTINPAVVGLFTLHF